MPDREKVIKGLECCKNKTMLWQHDQCPYHGFDEDCESNLHADTLAMLKEQEHKDKMYHALEEDWKRIKELLKEQEEQVISWIKQIAKMQQVHAPAGWQSEDQRMYNKGVWDGLQIAWNIISEGRIR